MPVLDDDHVLNEMREAWEASWLGTDDAHEEGGFVLRDAEGTLTVERWPRGAQNKIAVPDHPGGRVQGRVIVATFYTHPHPGTEYQQEPSLTDIRGVRDDLDLKHSEYEGEYVISHDTVYHIRPPGKVTIVGSRPDVL